MASRKLGTALQALPRRSLTCTLCQWRRTFAATALRPATTQKPGTGTEMDPRAGIAGTPIEAPRSYGKRTEGTFTPKPLPRPIGMPLPPRVGENTGLDHRTLKQRREDFVDYEKHVARRKELTAQMSRPYFRDWGNLQFHEGKSFLAPPRLFKAEVSLFFPNLYGRTLLKTDKDPRDTTPLLRGKASVVSIFSSQWAEQQANSFISKTANPALHELIAQSGDVAQVVRINYEDNAGKALMIKLFMGSLRRQFAEKDWDKYYLVQRGVTDNIRESIGLLNSKVGYTYIVDQHCRVRWAGSATAHPEERESLVRGLKKVVEEIRKEAALPAAARETLVSKRLIEQTKT
ncbi:hypothetical protein S7711_00873 [Stachybotrys chartarum IBT 7711]|uniref:Mitochondrial ATPase complex subunit ATP10 n=1 Tax=Stachybotrys chartarum (strain CBS 109288 / IBT 7711) TaxID=1280523 RepID=A0A084B0H0_STACB|nr:hypothetical protein S7711_00873 [Stachybotrys chartarum IBT 7711]KFA50162.1 hypothetical protein S40293_03673 [Stachybotrys chartarum IBT 40293]